MARTHNVQTPGTNPAPAAPVEAQADDQASVNEAAATEQTQEPQVGEQAPEPEQAPAAPVEAIDPTTITRPVMTKDGWLVPEPKAK